MAEALGGAIMHRLRTVVALSAISCAVFLIGPRAAPLGLALLALIPFIAPRRPDIVPGASFSLPLWGVCCLVFALYALVSALWAENAGYTSGKVAILVANVVVLILAGAWLWRISSHALQQVVRIFVVTGLVVGCYLLIEEVSGHAIKSALFDLLPALRPSAKHLELDADGNVREIAVYISNRNIAALALIAWPAALGACALATGCGRHSMALGVVGLALLTALLSEHQSSAVALVAGGIVFGLSLLSVKAARVLVVAAWIGACVLVVPATDYMYRTAGWHTASWLPKTWRQRVILWGYTAEQVPLRPVTGVGAASTKALDNARREQAERPPGYVYERRTGPHAHNFYLQVWYELGAFGAAIFMAFGLALVRAISVQPRFVQPYLLATFAASASMAAFSWGMWQGWFVSAFGLAGLLVGYGVVLARRGRA